MLLALALTLAVARQNIPDSAYAIYTGVPACGSPGSVQLVTHDASVQLTKTDWTLDSLSYLKNVSNKVSNITVSIPVEAHNLQWGMMSGLTISATVDGSPVRLKKMGAHIEKPTDQHQLSSGVVAESFSQDYNVQLNFIGRGAHSLRIHLSGPIGHAGLDGTQRLIGYDLAGGSSWNGDISQLNFSIKYTPSIVFQVFSALPPNSWQVGATGAFIEQKNPHPGPNDKYLFTYYAGGYGKLGG